MNECIKCVEMYNEKEQLKAKLNEAGLEIEHLEEVIKRFEKSQEYNRILYLRDSERNRRQAQHLVNKLIKLGVDVDALFDELNKINIEYYSNI